MGQPSARRRVVTYQQHNVEAYLWESHSATRLETYISDMIEWDDEWLESIYELLSGCCSRKTSNTWVEDPMMFHGEAWKTWYDVFETCPGKGVDHNCLLARTEHLTMSGGMNGSCS